MALITSFVMESGDLCSLVFLRMQQITLKSEWDHFPYPSGLKQVQMMTGCCLLASNFLQNVHVHVALF